MAKTILIAGSRALPKGQAARLLVRSLASLEADALILLRRGRSTEPGHFEVGVTDLCEVLGLRYEWCRPLDTGDGRLDTFERDLDMIGRADLVLAFFHYDQREDETSGTVALVEKALQLDKPVYAYAVDNGGDIDRVGEHDPEHTWVNVVPSL